MATQTREPEMLAVTDSQMLVTEKLIDWLLLYTGIIKYDPGKPKLLVNRNIIEKWKFKIDYARLW